MMPTGTPYLSCFTSIELLKHPVSVVFVQAKIIVCFMLNNETEAQKFGLEERLKSNFILLKIFLVIYPILIRIIKTRRL